MNIQKFTQKSLQAVQNCERFALEYGNQEIEQEHLFYALLEQEDSLILKLFEKMGIDKNMAIHRAEEALRKRTKVQGGKQFIGQDLNKALIHAEDEAKQMTFISSPRICSQISDIGSQPFHFIITNIS